MKSINSQYWNETKFLIIDNPLLNEIYESRISSISNLISNFYNNNNNNNNNNEMKRYCDVIEIIECKGYEHLHKYLSIIISNGGEGIMLRKNKSMYESGRSSTLLKVKVNKRKKKKRRRKESYLFIYLLEL